MRDVTPGRGGSGRRSPSPLRKGKQGLNEQEVARHADPRTRSKQRSVRGSTIGSNREFRAASSEIPFRSLLRVADRVSSPKLPENQVPGMEKPWALGLGPWALGFGLGYGKRLPATGN